MRRKQKIMRRIDRGFRKIEILGKVEEDFEID